MWRVMWGKEWLCGVQCTCITRLWYLSAAAAAAEDKGAYISALNAFLLDSLPCSTATTSSISSMMPRNSPATDSTFAWEGGGVG